MHTAIETSALAARLPLESTGPHPDIPSDQRIFEPLIGSWQLNVTWYRDGKPCRREMGEWHFSWALEGRGIQDVWIVPSRPQRNLASELYEYGTSVRFYDARLGAWQSVWIGPMRGLVRIFTARRVAEGILLETSDAQDPRLRWVFSEIANTSFRWSNYEEVGGSFALVQDFLANRTK